ncbi:hypothetical protein V2O64_20455 [Verrucomicrobiaceae bacterium 227]
MKTILTAAFALTASLGSALAENDPRVLLMTDKETYSGFMVSADKTKILWKESEASTVRRQLSLATTTVYFVEPAEFTEALELYKSRNYKDARTKFAACAELYEKVREVKGNFSTLAKFYEMECARKLEDLDGLMALHEKFDPENLLHDFHKLQVRIDGIFWDAVRTKSWVRLDGLVMDDEWRNARLPGNLRAQLAYCHGLALEGMNQPTKALNAYNGAFVADFGASEEITKKAALNCLRILSEHPDVKLAMQLYKTEDYSDDSSGAFLIKEGTALIKLWDKTLGAGEKLPANYKVFLKYPPKN